MIGSIRHRLLANGARLVGGVEDADIVMEVRSGGLGTNQNEGFVGIPAIGVPGFPVEFPEVKLITQETQSGLVKLGIVAYDAKTGMALGEGGTAIARANEDNWYVFGVGPFQDGTVSNEVYEATGHNDSLTTNYIASDETIPCRGYIRLADEQPEYETQISTASTDTILR